MEPGLIRKWQSQGAVVARSSPALLITSLTATLYSLECSTGLRVTTSLTNPCLLYCAPKAALLTVSHSFPEVT